MQYKVKVFNKNGEIEERLIEAVDKSALFASLKKDEIKPISFEELKSNRKITFNLKALNKKFSTVKEKDKIIFARNLGAMLGAGLAISRAIFVMKKQAKNLKFKAVLEDIEDYIKKGNNLSNSLSRHPKVFSSIFVAMVKAGEESGSLTESLKVVSLQMEKAYTLKKKIRGAMIYPGIILFAAFTIGILMLMFVVPTLTETFKELDVELPLSTRSIIIISDFMKNHTLIFLGAFIAIAGSLYSYLRTAKGKRNLDFVLLHTPLISGLVRETNSARTSRTLSSLLSSGVEVVNALSITKDVIQNSYYKDILKESEEKVQKGVQLSEIFSKYEDLYPVFVGEMINVGEETGKLPEMLLSVAVFYEDDIDQKTKNMSTIIEPFLMIFIGAFVGFFALSMISPIYSLSSGI
jgi:type IV pilus assembly protein PilC